MILYPAIDLKDGQCVRLLHGDMAQATVFSDSPVAQAQVFARAGAEWLHVVDLNGAFAGRSENAGAVKDILSAGLPVQLGGGIRSVADAAMWLERGVVRIIFGTAAVKHPKVVREACRAFPGRVAVGIDARDGFVAVEGWAETSELRAEELARRFEDAGVAALIHTDIARDGAMCGPNVEATAALAKTVDIPVIASGGVSSLSDLQRIRDTKVIAGAISGRALYDGALDLRKALALMAR